MSTVDETKANIDALERLAPEARARVNAALKADIQKELAGQVGPGLRAEFSKGAFFSRSRGTSLMDESQILEQAKTLDAQAFSKFAQNLQTLKSIKQP